MNRVKAAVVGAGAAGLMAAWQLAKALGPGAVALLEGNPKPGKKLLATGNGRCNLTNLHISPARYHGDAALAEGFLSAWPARRVTDAFASLGLLTRADGEGRVYPRSLQAAAVLQALWAACEEQGAALLCDFETVGLAPAKGGFWLTAKDGRTLWAGRCVLACGGMASPRHSCGEKGYGLAKSLGHSVTPLVPGLAPLRCPKKITAPLKGMRAKARASLWVRGREVAAESGEVIFGEGNLSGICMMNLSLALGGGTGEVVLDLAEGLSRDELAGHFRRLQQARPAMPCRDIFSGLLNLRIGQQLSKGLGFTGERPLGALPVGELCRAAEAVKAWRLPVSPADSWDSAQVTAGGVPLSEVDLATMESRKCPGLYFCGEILNIHGDCGGYNLHWAWATGMAAAAGLARGLGG